MYQRTERERVDPGAGQRPPGPDDGKGRRATMGLWPWLLLLLLMATWIGPNPFQAGETIPYSEFKHQLAEKHVKQVVLDNERVRGLQLVTAKPAPSAVPAPEAHAAKEPTVAEKEPEKDPEKEAKEPQWKPFVAVRPEDPGLIDALERAGVEYSVERSSAGMASLLMWFVPGVLALVFMLWLLRSAARREGAGVLGFGKSRARLVPETSIGVTFDDVAGCDEAKADLREMVEFLRDPTRFRAVGARIPKGVLLVGPPGTGKTLLARAIAGEAGVPFFSLNGSDFVEMFVGVGAARVRDLFVQAKGKAPCIVFIDEIDAVGRQRGVSMGVVNDEREQTLNQLLSEMDGFEENSGVIVLAATNRPEVLDRALLRPGRFDRQIVLDAPDRQGRLGILRVHARGKPVAADVDLQRIAQATPGMSGADLANALNEAALTTARERRREITQADLEAAIERVLAGPERRSRRLGPDEKRRVAVHEAGHAIVAAHVPHADPVQKISIVPRGRAALGYTMQIPQQEQFLRTRAELDDRLAVLLGGRAAEQLVLADVSTGGQDDLEVATALARQMVCVLGMSDRVGLQRCAQPNDSPLAVHPGGWLRDCSEATAREVDEEVRRLLDEALARARSVLGEHRDTLERVAGALLERESLDHEAFEGLLAQRAAAGAPCRNSS
ncbi:MAG TPA: ATP-dependent zinc metalloprotease FtsH [Planctomycetota bacterium]|nr:ATP-dependent zinc metalloprotease FtsH [Planctomycetota bacterium]